MIQKLMEFVRTLGAAPKAGNVGLPNVEATVRGFSAVSLVVVDEAARVREEMYTAVRPMLALKNG
ncbi:MAG: hypothetical protein JJE04_16110, partial [Acidobacteriia bacterium]|nr:hypothetical protein [Terriglobia bacterium]